LGEFVVAATSWINKQIGGYRLTKFLDQGGMGVVYKGEKIETFASPEQPQIVAVKLVKQADVDNTERFFTEIKNLERLSNQPNIVKVHDWGRIGGVLFITMDYYPGGTLGDLMQKRQQISPDRLVSILKDVATGLDAAHSKEIIHRDIKPANVLFDEGQQTAYLSDFGLAKHLRFDPTRTSEKVMIGTWIYMAPELFDEQPASRLSDLYSFGVLAYDFLTGFPIKRKVSSYAKILNWHQSPHKRLLSEIEQLGISKAVALTVNKMISVDPELRFASASEFVDCLEQAFHYPEETERLLQSTKGSARPYQSMAKDGSDSENGTELPPNELMDKETRKAPVFEADTTIPKFKITAFYPERVKANKAYTLLAFAYLSDPQTWQRIQEVVKKYGDRLDGSLKQTSETVSVFIEDNISLTFIPEIDGVVFEPRQQTVLWPPGSEGYRQVAFHFQTPRVLPDRLEGEICVYYKALALGKIPLHIEIGGENNKRVPSELHNFNKVFLSYSHKDHQVMKTILQTIKVLTEIVYIDCESLRAGDRWNERLQEMIKESNIFQLLWSKNSAISPYCQQEWTYALTLVDEKPPRFICPVYWSEKIDPEPPPELRDYQFAHIPLHFQTSARPPIYYWAAVLLIVTAAGLWYIFRSNDPETTALSTAVLAADTLPAPTSTLTFTSTATPSITPSYTLTFTPTATKASPTLNVPFSYLITGHLYVSDLITNKSYRYCLESGSCERLPNNSIYPLPQHENEPVVNVTWSAASEYCLAYGWRLMMPMEWEKLPNKGAIREWLDAEATTGQPVVIGSPSYPADRVPMDQSSNDLGFRCVLGG
jgi:serine/threonine protein kinase